MSEALPYGWCEVPLPQIGLPSTSTIDPQRHKDETFELYSVPSFDTGLPETVNGASVASTRQHVEPGDILLCKINPRINRVWLVKPRGLHRQIASTEWIVVRAQGLDPRFLMYQMREAGFRERLLEDVSGVGGSLMRARSAGIRTLTLRVAPLAEQRRIVTRIETLFARTRRARADLKRIMALVTIFRERVLAAALRGDLTDDFRSSHNLRSPGETLSLIRKTRQKEALEPRRAAALQSLPPIPGDLPGLPAEWTWACVEELASDAPRSIQSGPFGSSLLHSEFTKEGRLVIGIDNVQDGFFSPGSQNRIPDEKFSDLVRFEARPRDVLITVMATVGRCCVVPDDIERAIITKHVYRITVEPRLTDPHYLMNTLRGSEAVLTQMGANIRGQTRPGINGEILKALYVPLPSLEEQQEVVARVDMAMASITKTEKDARRVIALLDHLEQTILTKAFRGELVPQDPADEPAEALLARLERPESSMRRRRARETAPA